MEKQQMQVLEKILQEIAELEKERPYKIFGFPDTYDKYNEVWQDCLDRVENIIRAHMEDEPASNTYNLDDDKKEFINIQDERLWDILFEEACVEGEQANRIEERLKEICVFSTEDDEWIPVERKDDRWTLETVLPEENQQVWITIEFDNGERVVREAVFKDRSFCYKNHIIRDLITKAWRRFPTPYQPKEKR